MNVTGSLAAAVLGLALTTACGAGSQGAGDVVEPGDIVSSTAPGVLDGTDHSVVVPTGTLVVTVTDPATDVAAAETTDGRELRADDGSRIVGVSWSLEAGQGLPDEASLALGEDPQEPVVALASSDESVEVGQANEHDPVYVGVADEDVSLTVEYDGVTQSVDLDTGKVDRADAGGLYSLVKPSAAQDCGGVNRANGVRVETSCSATLVRLPYVGSLGWAAEGKDWSVVAVTSDLTSATSGNTDYRVTSAADASTMAGNDPDAILTESDAESGAQWSGRLVFSTSVGQPVRVVIGHEYDLEAIDGTGPSERHVTVRSPVSFD